MDAKVVTAPTELLPCPFCGGEAERSRTLVAYPADAKYPAGEYEAFNTIRCTNCGIEMGDEYLSDVAAAWNARPVSAAEGDLLGRCLEALDALEKANDRLAAVRSRPTYYSYLSDGANPQLSALDDARSNARAILSQVREVRG